MIHTLHVTPDSDLGTLQKEMRKRLMTGGAVIRIAEGVSELELQGLLERFLPEARPFNLATQVLVEIARSPEISLELRSRLKAANLPEVNQVLATV